MLQNTWFETKTSLRVVRELASECQESVRFGVGFFTIKGWDLIRNLLKDRDIYLLVGEVEPSAKQAKQLLTKRILADLNTGIFENRYQAVLDIYERIVDGKFRVFDARSLRHHAKIYIFDKEVAVIGSSNLTVNGLTYQIEAGSISRNRDDVMLLAARFDEYFQKAEDLTESLRQTLEDWLKMSRPFDAYLKFISLAEKRPRLNTKYKKVPASYQQHTINSCLQQLQKYRGSMLVASTGLGKTVMAIHIALTLYKQGEIDFAVIFGPAQGVEINWKSHIFESFLPAEYVGTLALDQKENNYRIKDLEKIAQLLKESPAIKTLIIIDECHLLRNKYRKKERLAYKRVQKLCHLPNTKVLLMTATPIGKELEELNNQLALLPYTNPESFLLFEEIEGAKSWQIQSIDAFNYLPIVTQMTTAHVGGFYAQKDEIGLFILRGIEKVYLPDLTLRSYKVKPVFYEKIAQLLAEDFFDCNSFGNEESAFDHSRMTANITRFIKISLFSSPWVLKHDLKSVSETGEEFCKDFGYNIHFHKSQAERQETLIPLFEELEQFNNLEFAINYDKKLRNFLNIVNSALSKRMKVIVFVERKPTAIYLEEMLRHFSPQAKVAATIKQHKDGTYSLKATNETQELVTQFAPLANNSSTFPDEYNVFIGTDAHGIGLNMQDAQIVINYDISWTPIQPSQRAGRILRFTPNPRNVEVFTFFPGDVESNTELGLEINGDVYQERQGLLRLSQRGNTLIDRHNQAQEIVKVPTLTIKNALEVDLTEGVQEIASEVVDLEALDRVAGLKTSEIFKHFALASKHESYINKLGDDIVSAMEVSDRSSPILLLALSYQEKVHFLVYSPSLEKLESNIPLNSFFDLAECNQETEIALTHRTVIEQVAHDCIQKWVKQNKANPEEVIRECVLYLTPVPNKSTEISDFLADDLAADVA